MFRTYDNIQWRKVDISKIPLIEGSPVKYIQMNDGDMGIKDVTQELLLGSDFLTQ